MYIVDFLENGFDGGGEIVCDKEGNFMGILRDNVMIMVIDFFFVVMFFELSVWFKIVIIDLWLKGIMGVYLEDLYYFMGFILILVVF